jgi:hypothetical protein
MFDKWKRRRGEERTLGTWPTWTTQTPNELTPQSALAVADVWAAVKLLSDSAAALPLIVYRRTESGRQRLGSGRLAGLLEQSAPATRPASTPMAWRRSGSTTCATVAPGCCSPPTCQHRRLLRSSVTPTCARR